METIYSNGLYNLIFALQPKIDNRYILPVPENLLERVDKTSSPAHVGKL